MKVRKLPNKVKAATNKAVKKDVKADFDAETFKQRHKAAKEKREARKDPINIINQIRESEDPISTAFELLVPSSGAADTVAGEMIRAMMRILYRDYNDGDVFYDGYGIETCGDAVAYLCDKMPDLEQQFEDIALRNFTDAAYTDSIQEIADEVLDEIYADPDLVTTKNTEDMFNFDGEGFIKDHEWVPEYEFECTIPDNLYAHIEAGNLSERDMQEEMQYWDYLRDADIDVNSYYVRVSDIDKDTFDVLESEMYTWLEQWGEDLDRDFGVPGEDDYEEEEE